MCGVTSRRVEWIVRGGPGGGLGAGWDLGRCPMPFRIFRSLLTSNVI